MIIVDLLDILIVSLLIVLSFIILIQYIIYKEKKMNEALKYFKEYGKALERMNSSRKRLVSIWYSSKSIQYRITKAAIIRERHYRIVKDASNKINRWTSLDFRNIWRVEDELELYPSLSEAKEELSSWQYERR